MGLLTEDPYEFRKRITKVLAQKSPMQIKFHNGSRIIFKGMDKVIKKYHPNLLLEIHPNQLKEVFNSSAEEVISLLTEKYSYHLTPVDKETLDIPQNGNLTVWCKWNDKRKK